MALDIDRFAHLESSLHRWDPRAKIIAMVLFILVVAVLKTIPFALVALALAFVALTVSKIPLSFMAHGLKWVFLFLMPFFFILPLSYPGEPAFHVLGLPFAWEGLRLAILIVLKSVAIVITAYTIFGSARFDVSMIALQHLKCPKVIVQMLLFTYRYIFVFIAEMKRQDIAMKARGFVKRPNKYTINVLGGFIGTLLVRSFERTDRVYKAMLSKGYQGELHSLVEFNSTPKDSIKAGLVVVLAIALLIIDWMGVFQIAERGWY